MASLSTDANGNRTVQFVGGDGKRRSVRLGKVPKKVAEGVKLRVEALAASAASRLPLDGETAAWVAGVGDDLAAKLAAVGLIPARHGEAVGPFLDAYLNRRRADAKGGTVTNLVTVANDVRGFFGEVCPLRDIDERRADEFRTHYLTRSPKLAAATVARRLNTVKQFFDFARRMKYFPANPFADVSAPSLIPEARRHYVPAADAHRLLAACNPTWRVIVALSRFAGLRNPSEVLSLKWEHVNFGTGRMTVPSPKTEHHPGKAYRVVPIFPELRPVLDDAWELAVPGDEYVVGGKTGAGYRAAADRPGGWMNANLRTTFEKIVRRAGLVPWPRLFHNLRASCETDLMQHHPIHVVCSWLGNTPAVALRHYLTVQDRDFEKALNHGAESGAAVVQKPVQSAAAGSRPETSQTPQPPEAVGVGRLLSAGDICCHYDQVGGTGFEPVTSSV